MEGYYVDKKMERKKRVEWRRISVSVSEELYDLLEQRATLAGVSLSRFAFTILKRKKVVIIPGFAEFICQLKQICRELNTAKNDQVLLRELIVSINRIAQFYEGTTTGVMYPFLVEKDSGRYVVTASSKNFNTNNLFEV